MTFTLTYPTVGRGSFATNAKLGGTLSADGKTPGPYYRAPGGPGVPMPGLIGALAVRGGTTCDINAYAVHRAVKALQPHFGATPDGILGPRSDAAIKAWQKARNLVADGIIGPKSTRFIFEPIAIEAATALNTGHADMVRRIVVVTITVESAFDLGAVGVTTPQDLGVAQINGPAHPSMSVDARLDPVVAIEWMATFIEGNLKEFGWDQAAGILAFNLGRTGVRYWIEAGRPQWFRGTDTTAYVSKILGAS